VLLLRFVNRLRGGGDPPALIAQHIRQPLDGLFTMLGDTHLHAAPIFAGAIGLAPHQPALLGAIHQADDGVVSHLQALGQFGDVGCLAAGEAPDGE